MIDKIIEGWLPLSSVLKEPQNQEEYDQLGLVLDHLVGVIGEDESHELIGLAHIVNYLLTRYDFKRQCLGVWRD